MKKLIERAGHRGAFLAFLVLLDWLYGYSILTDAGPLDHLHLFLPVPVWGWIWIIVGVALATGVFTKHDRFHYGLSATFKTAWAAALINVQLTQHMPRIWISVVIWLAFAALVVVVSSWPESRRHVLRERDEREKRE
jgi:FtsH-binding integral membrane protein